MVRNIDNSDFSSHSASQASSSQSSNSAEQTREDQLTELQRRVLDSQFALLQALGAAPNTLNQFRGMNDSERRSVLMQHSEIYQDRMAEPRNDHPLQADINEQELAERDFNEQEGVLIIGGPNDNSGSRLEAGPSPAAGG